MPRIRTIKPEFWVDEKIVELSPWARLLFIAMFNFADDQGYVDLVPKRLRMQVFPGDKVNVEPLVDELRRIGVVRAYQSPIGPVLHIVHWTRHQRVQKPGVPRFTAVQLRPYPDPPEPSTTPPEPSTTVPVALPEPSTMARDLQIPVALPEPYRNPPEEYRAERKGKEGKGKEGKGVPPTAGASSALVLSTTDSSHNIIAEWIDHCRKRPPGNVIGQVGKTIKMMLAEGIDPTDVRRGLAAWHSKGLHPSTLPSVVNQMMNATGGIGMADRPSTTDMRVAAGLRLAAKFDAMDAAAGVA